MESLDIFEIFWIFSIQQRNCQKFVTLFRILDLNMRIFLIKLLILGDIMRSFLIFQREIILMLIKSEFLSLKSSILSRGGLTWMRKHRNKLKRSIREYQKFLKKSKIMWQMNSPTFLLVSLIMRPFQVYRKTF